MKSRNISMALLPVTSSTVASAVSFSTITQALSDLMVSGYGASIKTNNVTAGNTVKTFEWQNLVDDVQRISVHQRAQIETFEAGLPQSQTVLSTAFVNDIITLLTSTYATSATVAVSQLGSSTEGGVSTRTSAWGSTITQEVTYTWTSAAQARTYYNLGSHSTFAISLTMPGSPGSDDTTWQSLIALANTRLAGFKYAYSEYTNASATVYANWTGSALTWTTNSSDSIAVNGSNTVKLSATRSGATVVFALSLNPAAGANISADIISTVTNYYSRGDVAVEGVTGIGAPLPDVQVTNDFGGGAITPPFVPKKILSVSTPATFNLVVDTTSNTQTVTISNIGNTATTITGITYTSNGGLTAVGTYHWSAPYFPKTLSSGTNVTFALAYTGNTIGSFNNSFTVNSNNDAGPITVQTSQVVSAPAFTFTLSPSSWTASATTPDVIQQKFTLVPNDGSAVGTGYSASWASGTTTGFSISQTSGGPTVVFDPTASGVTNTTYSPVLSVTYGGVTKTANVAITRNLPTSYNLGTWVSAIQRSNAVVGMSYDVIGSQRYLTIGFSLGEDGSLSSALSPGYQSYVNVASLGISGDTKYSSGMVVYEMLNSSNHVQFLKDYGVWPRSSSNQPIGVWIKRSYTFNAPTAGTYNWIMSVDNEGYFTIDNGDPVGDMRGYGEPYTYTIDGTVDLTAGNHLLSWYVYNASGGADNPGGIAIQLSRASDSLEVYNTQDAVRASAPYQYWREVYRIPIQTNGVAQTLYSNDYRIKDSNAAYANAYGYYFTPSMFTIENDGTGLLTITFNTNTGIPPDPAYNLDVVEFRFLPYYYSERISGSTNVRVTNLESGPIGDGDQTTFFLGFNSNGSVRTNLQQYPRGGGSGGGGGGGCPDPSTPILLPDYSSKPAGDLKVGDTVLTVHEHTGELGEYAVSAVQFEEQPKVKITFVDHTEVIVSDTHKFLMSDQTWRQVFDISVGDKVSSVSSTQPEKEILSLEKIGIGAVVKIEIEEAHTYIANGLISHNIKVVDPELDIEFSTQ